MPAETSYQYRFLAIAIIAPSLLVFILLTWTSMELWLCYLIAINLSSVAFLAYDKFAASSKEKSRVPELVLLFCTGCGGWTSPIAMAVLRHKTSKPGFLIVNLALILVQGSLLFFLLPINR